MVKMQEKKDEISRHAQIKYLYHEIQEICPRAIRVAERDDENELELYELGKKLEWLGGVIKYVINNLK